jgi:hypothetical protein
MLLAAPSSPPTESASTTWRSRHAYPRCTVTGIPSKREVSCAHRRDADAGLQHGTRRKKGDSRSWAEGPVRSACLVPVADTQPQRH